MKQIVLNKEYVIIAGRLDGIVGKVVGFDSIKDEVTLKLDDLTYIQTNSDNIEPLE